MVCVSEHIFSKISETQNPQGILIVVRKHQYTFGDLLITPGLAFIVVLDGIQDPGNVGAILRLADAAGCSGAILTSGCADLFASKTVRSTMGSLFRLAVVEHMDQQELLTQLTAGDIPLVATAMEAGVVYHEAPLSGQLAIAFGNEGQGISDVLLAGATQRIFIPIYGGAESLNVATAAAVVLYEAARQRREIL
jgi:TrmH family RNA methyltransferase